MIENVFIVGFSLFYIILVITKTSAFYEWGTLLNKIFNLTITKADFKLFFSHLFNCGICLSFWLSCCSSYWFGLNMILCLSGFISFLWILTVFLLTGIK